MQAKWLVIVGVCLVVLCAQTLLFSQQHSLHLHHLHLSYGAGAVREVEVVQVQRVLLREQERLRAQHDQADAHDDQPFGLHRRLRPGEPLEPRSPRRLLHRALLRDALSGRAWYFADVMPWF